MGAPTLWSMLRSTVKSVDNIAKFRNHLNAYLYNLTYPSWLPGVSLIPMTT